MNEKALLTFSDELKNVRDYVELENIRFMGKIHLHTKDSVPNWLVPKFSLQLLVENAIKHGFVDTSKELNIWISFDEKEKSVSVRNDGKSLESKKFGIGLNNLAQRLKLLCNGKIFVMDMTEVTYTMFLGECNENTHS